MFGSNAFGQLGWPTASLKCTDRPRPLNLPDAARVRGVSFGLRHLAIWTVAGDVYFAGRIKFAAHCTAVDWNGTQWWKLNSPGDIRYAASGQNHFVWATDDEDGSRVQAAGDNRFGQSEAVTMAGRVSDLTCGWTHNAALLADGRALLWGRNSYGQLATTQADAGGPVALGCDDPIRVQALHLGSEHGLAIAEDGRVLTWGWNEHGSCGNGSVRDV